MISALACLATTIYHEARGEPYDGQVAVAEVVLNRVADPRFPGNVCDVVREDKGSGARDCQFSFYCDGKSDKPAEMLAWNIAISVAETAGRGEVLEHGALFYHAESVNPSWASRMTTVGQVGSHVFYTDAEPPVRPRARPEDLKID